MTPITKRLPILLVLLALLISLLAVFPVSAANYYTTVTVGGGRTSIGPSDVERFQGASRIIVADGVREIKANTFSYFDAVSIQLPDTLTTLGDGAFRATEITSITIPDSVTTIGANCFQSCDKMKAVTIGNGVTTIGANAFSFTGITELTIPENVTYIGVDALAYNLNLRTLHYNAIDCEAPAEDHGWFGIYPNMEALTVGPRVERIPARAFHSATYLTELTIPTNVKEIGDLAFYGTGITALTLENGLESIGEGAFMRCDFLSEVSIPDSVTYIGKNAFSLCSNLENISISDPSLLEESTDQDTDFWLATFGVLLGILSASAVLAVLCLGGTVLLALTVEIITLVGCLRINRRYRELTGQSTVALSVLAVFLTLFGFGVIYLTVMALINHSKTQISR